MLHYLGSKGIQFQAWVRYKKNSELNAGSVFASTDDPEVVKTIFQIYGIDWLGHSHFFFCISEKDLNQKRDQIENLSSAIPRNLLDDVRCLLATYYDHSLEVVTASLKLQDLESAAKDAASALGLSVRLDKDRNGAH